MEYLRCLIPALQDIEDMTLNGNLTPGDLVFTFGNKLYEYNGEGHDHDQATLLDLESMTRHAAEHRRNALQVAEALTELGLNASVGWHAYCFTL